MNNVIVAMEKIDDTFFFPWEFDLANYPDNRRM